MILASSNVGDSYAQLITILLIFVAVLTITALTTKYIANIQKQCGMSGNIEILETIRVSNTKYIQLVRIGETYVAMAVCKDTITKLCEVPAEQLKNTASQGGSAFSFKELLETVMHKETKE